MESKHKSKLHKGFEKQVTRQNNKKSEVKIKLPIAIKLPDNFIGKYKHYMTVSNNKWNGMNLKNLYRSFNIIIVGGMDGKFFINPNGKYRLSIYGKKKLRLLKKKKEVA